MIYFTFKATSCCYGFILWPAEFYHTSQLFEDKISFCLWLIWVPEFFSSPLSRRKSGKQRHGFRGHSSKIPAPGSSSALTVASSADASPASCTAWASPFKASAWLLGHGREIFGKGLWNIIKGNQVLRVFHFSGMRTYVGWDTTKFLLVGTGPLMLGLERVPHVPVLFVSLPHKFLCADAEPVSVSHCFVQYGCHILPG